MVKSMNTFFLSLLGWFSSYTAVTITLCLQIHSVLASKLFPVYPTYLIKHLVIEIMKPNSTEINPMILIAENGRTKSNPQKNLANAIKCNWLFDFWQSFNWSAFGQFKINCLNWFCLEIHFSSVRRLLKCCLTLGNNTFRPNEQQNN